MFPELTTGLGQTWRLMTRGVRRIRPLADQQGMTLVTTMLMLVMLTFLGVAAISTTTSEMRLAGNDRAYRQAFFNAEAAVAYVVQRGVKLFTNTTNYDRDNRTPLLPPFLPTDLTTNFPGAALSYYNLSPSPRQVDVLAVGTAPGGGRVELIVGIEGPTFDEVDQGTDPLGY